MDAAHLLSVASALVEAPSISGAEGPALAVADRLLREAGLTVHRQAVGGDARFNLFASSGKPRMLLTTHLDTVPGDVPISVRNGVLQGRGACDAKGAAAAMLGAARELLRRGRSDFGILFVVGEETDSDGAKAADALLASGELGWSCADVLLGEPTGNRWVSAHPGVLMMSLRAVGRAAHSSDPAAGISAIHVLLDWIAALRSEGWPRDPVLGDTLFQVGRIEGGTAANVTAEHASADVMFRSGASPAELERRARALAPEGTSLSVTCAAPPVRFQHLEPSSPVAFASDAPFLAHAGRPWLFGPGSIRHAHAADEQVRGDELAAACATYVGWVEARLDAAAASRT